MIYQQEKENGEELYNGPVKVWMHLETLPEHKDEDPRSLDDEYLPMPVAVFPTMEEGIKYLEEMHRSGYYPEQYDENGNLKKEELI